METLVKERPILFSGPMVRALLARTKTQTRRIIKPQPIIDADSGYVYDGNHKHAYKNDLLHAPWQEGFARDLCPYGQPGDRLWMRETWKRHYHGGGGVNAPGVMYAADNAMRYVPQAGDFSDKKWVPSIHMYRWASRLLLEITAVRCERLQDISEADAKAEGATCCLENMHPQNTYDDVFPSARQHYHKIWANINGAGSWDDNPWVWVVEFKIVTPS